MSALLRLNKKGIGFSMQPQRSGAVVASKRPVLGSGDPGGEALWGLRPSERGGQRGIQVGSNSKQNSS